MSGEESFVSPGSYLVIAYDGKATDFLVGVYGPFGTRDQAHEAALRHTKDGIRCDFYPLWPTSELGGWS